MTDTADNEPCGHCDHGLYACGGAYKHIDLWAAMPLSEQKMKQRQCKMRPHIKCQGEQDIMNALTDADRVELLAMWP